MTNINIYFERLEDLIISLLRNKTAFLLQRPIFKFIVQVVVLHEFCWWMTMIREDCLQNEWK